MTKTTRVVFAVKFYIEEALAAIAFVALIGVILYAAPIIQIFSEVLK